MDEKEKSRELRNAIRNILMRRWDPIGVKDVPEAADEYDMYIGNISDLLTQGISSKELSEHLVKIETGRMGLTDAKGKPLLPDTLREAAVQELQSLREQHGLSATVPGSKRFRHWKLFSKHLSPAYEKTQDRRRRGVCIACGYDPCRCKNPKRTAP